MSKKILFLVPYPPGESPSQRFRFEQYLPLLKSRGLEIKIQSFLSSSNWKIFFGPGKSTAKIFTILGGFAKRWFILFQSSRFDLVFIHRETTPLGPPVMEWILAKILRKKIIYDFDDAIWSTDRANEPALLRIAKWRSKVSSICKWSYKISCGNQYLISYASKYNVNVKYIPTTIDTKGWHNPDKVTIQKRSDIISIGWTGSHSTLKYLEEIEDVLQQLEKKYAHVQFVVIADRKPDLALKSLRFIPWNKNTEAEDLMTIDIGIMPLPDDEWSKGKCGFKALQYFALKIPAVVSPVGVNTSIVTENVNGFFATTPEKWFNALSRLIEDSGLRGRMGEAGRSKVMTDYSVDSVSDSFVSLFE